ncbi:dCTP deaminase domain-containing protein [Fictibacillus phosphorivorans]|uniref:dCTP deaminase domain-containing protein n=1 Tax=Fictibacillus phosphorivorans TaxID=1221500 RepID=UPI0035E5A92E
MLLSNNDIKREIIKVKNISIYPLMVENIKGSSINLTASAHAWNIETKESIVDSNKKKLHIPANSTVSIFTQEAIWVSRRIGGTYHPRVSLVAKGLSNISTTLDPQWYGLSLVTVSNTSNKPIELRVGEAFVSVMLYYLNTKATKGIIDNQASRPDLYSKFNLNDDDEQFLSEQWHRNYHGIVQKMKKSESYNYLVKDKSKFIINLSNFFKHPLTIAVCSVLLTVIATIVMKKFGIK